MPLAGSDEVERIGQVAGHLGGVFRWRDRIGFAGQHDPVAGHGFRRRFLVYTIAGYGIALLVSLYVLWTFGRTDGADLARMATMTAVLGFPAAVGAAIARLVV